MAAADLVNNARLHRAAIELGLDQFMILEGFVPKAWKPETSTPQQTTEQRKASTKTIADHVEALIAVAYLSADTSDSKDTRAIAFLNMLLPDILWKLPSINATAVSSQPSVIHEFFGQLSIVEQILGYNFRQRQILAEALNHSSMAIHVPTYGRLEFLGDAVLQRIVNEEVYKASDQYSQSAMHLRQIACVSHSYLVYLCFGAYHDVERVNVSTNLVQKTATLERTTDRKYLWEFMMHSNPDIAPAQQRSLKRYLECGDRIKRELEQSKTYPWSLLASIAAPKFFSDIVESVLAAVYIDSGADLGMCTRVLDKLGLVSLLRRLIDEPHMVLETPKTILWHERAKAGLPALKVANQRRKEMEVENYYCQLLLLEDEVYAEVADAWCEEEAVHRACEVGLERFRMEQQRSALLEVEASQISLEDESGQLKRKRKDSLASASAPNSLASDSE